MRCEFWPARRSRAGALWWSILAVAALLACPCGERVLAGTPPACPQQE